MALPASENTTTLVDGYVIKETVPGGNDHIPITAGATIAQGDLVKATPYFGIADTGIANGAVGTIHVGQQVRFGAAVTGAAQTFYTWGQAVYYDTTDGLLYEASAANRMLIGYVNEVASASNAVFAVDCLRFHGAVA
jgi:predicted RecA/RadA family phage recombinase